MFRRTLGYCAVVGVLFLAACGDEFQSTDATGGSAGSDAGTGGSGGGAGSAGSAGSGPTVPLEDVPDMLIGLQCEMLMECAEELIQIYMPGVDCETMFGLQFRDSDWFNIEKGINEGRIIYHGDKAQDCIDAWRELQCDVFESRQPPVCEETLEGTVEQGGYCIIHAECIGNHYCKADGACPGNCAPRESEGSPCGDDDACKDGLYCDPMLGCARYGKENSPCGGGQHPECALGTFCFGATDTSSGLCRPFEEVFAGGLDDSCNLDGGPLCKAGLSCVIATNPSGPPGSTCREKVGLNAPCGFGLPSQCPPTQYCDANVNLGVLEGKCVPLPGEGAPCVSWAPIQQCMPYHVCDEAGLCREMQRIGGPCSVDGVCYSEHCDGQSCAPNSACIE
jgi:hypothetical protein